MRREFVFEFCNFTEIEGYIVSLSFEKRGSLVYFSGDVYPDNLKVGVAGYNMA